MKLTVLQKEALTWLRDMQDEYPHQQSFNPTFRPRQAAACRRVLEGAGLVVIYRQAENDFRYTITSAGRAALESEEA